MKHQALFSLKNKSKNIKVLSAAILLGALRVTRSSSSCFILFIFEQAGSGVSHIII